MNDYLIHYGVEGMKWGVRRYQNPDGSLTTEGRVHYGKKDAKLHAKVDKTYSKKTAKYNAILNNKNSSEEARRKASINLEAETKLRDLRHEEIDSGHAYLEKTMTNRAIAGALIAGVPGAVVASGYTYAKAYNGSDPRFDTNARRQIELERNAKLKKNI